MSTYGVRVSNNFRSIHASEVGLVDESQQQNKQLGLNIIIFYISILTIYNFGSFISKYKPLVIMFFKIHIFVLK